jgi:hypothetical protein
MLTKTRFLSDFKKSIEGFEKRTFYKCPKIKIAADFFL